MNDEQLIDKLLLFLFCTILLLQFPINFITVTALLTAFSLSCFYSYFPNTVVLFLSGLAYLFICCFYPTYFLYLPLLCFDFHKKLYLSLLPFYVFTWIFVSKNYAIHTVFFLLLLTFLSLYLSHKNINSLQKEQSLKSLRDDSKELQLLLEQKQKEIILKKETEIHLATLQERNRIAREIHDNVGHMLSRSLLQVGALMATSENEKLSHQLHSLKDTLNTAMNSIRTSVHDLKDESVILDLSIREILKDFSNYQIHFVYDVPDSVQKDLKYCFLSIIKEALTNIARHSNADSINLILRKHPAFYQLLIEDNGTVQIQNQTSGIGLQNMEERINSFQGTFTVTSKNGFRIFITIPIKNLH